MRIAVLKESAAGEHRVAATPETVKKFIALGAAVAIEEGAGTGASIPDESYREAGAEVVTGPQAVAGADIVLGVQAPDPLALAGALLSVGGAAVANHHEGKNPMVGGAAMYPTKDIIDNAVNSKDHTTLVAAVKAAGLVETINFLCPLLLRA